MAEYSETVDAILRFPAALAEYQTWLGKQPKNRDDSYLFSRELTRFEPRAADLLVAAGDLELQETDDGTRLFSPSMAARAEVRGVAPDVCQRFLRLMKGDKCCAEIAWSVEAPRDVLETLLRAAFGVLIFAPKAVEDLERRLTGLEVMRFPGSPYELSRPYWENVAAITEQLADLDGRLMAVASDPPALERLLRELHVMLLLGRDQSSFYRPASPIAERGGVYPGQFLTSKAVLAQTGAGILFVSGPSVNASRVGGDRYHRLLYQDLGDADAFSDSAQLVDPDGTEWGERALARAPHDPGFLPWFFPPRPITPRHWALLAVALAEAVARAQRGDLDGVIQSLARFHQCFVRLHPFQCGNQALAMAIANHVLRISHGAGIPHLLLDHFAFRLGPQSYQDLWQRAIRAYLRSGLSAIERYQTLREVKRLSYGLIARIGASGSDEDARQLLRSEPEAARAALLVSRP